MGWCNDAVLLSARSAACQSHTLPSGASSQPQPSRCAPAFLLLATLAPRLRAPPVALSSLAGFSVAAHRASLRQRCHAAWLLLSGTHMSGRCTEAQHVEAMALESAPELATYTCRTRCDSAFGL